MDTAVQLAKASSGIQWTIATDDQEAVVVEVGGGVRTYAAGGVEVVDGYSEAELCPSAAGQILAPWPNRIRDGRYAFGGPHQLTLTEPDRNNAIHGLVCWTRWRQVDRAPDRIVVEHDLVPQPGYPWPLRLRTAWSVGAGGLRADHEVTNLGVEACPFGLASHPYLIVPDVAVDDLTLSVPAGSRLLSDSRGLPIGAAKVAGGEYDFRAGRKIGACRLDVAFGDVEQDEDGRSAATIVGPDGGGVCVWADASFGWWQVYTGDTLPPTRNRRSVALEPMTCPPDAFRSGRDLVVLNPGDVWRGSWGIRRVLG
ncbi:MAG: aldose 1-epimerase family protein [Dactylosporangium sp.]|nr:aldose 1-epimerase family protein [Dactylosporangium sp.]NNJ60220.1 aldose 1-epimerase family protein [Dactylosporangium sp.]